MFWRMRFCDRRVSPSIDGVRLDCSDRDASSRPLLHGAGSASRRSSILLELGLGGKFQAKSSGWDENRTFLEGDVLEVAVRNGRRALIHVPAGPRSAPLRPSTFSDRGSDGVTGVCDIVTWAATPLRYRVIPILSKADSLGIPKSPAT